MINPEIAFIFDPNRDLFPNKPYYDDGNPDFYSEENIKKWESLKEDPVVKEAIDNFIAREFKSIYNDEKPISKQEYIQTFLKIALILRPGIEPDELQQIVKDDYENDNQNNPTETITRPRLYDSLFELADIWCPNIDAEEYKDFFEYLLFRFRYGN